MTMPVPEYLAKPEETLFIGRTHAKILFKPALIQLVLIAAHIVIFKYWPDKTGIAQVDAYGELVIHGLILLAELWFVVWPFLQWRYSSFEVTDRRIRQRWGVLHKHSREINLDRITQVNEERQLIDRIFRCGTIVIHDAANATAIRFHDVPHFRHVRTTIDSARHDVHVRTMTAASTPGPTHPGHQEGW